ncbi:hypothetical protein DFH28DRAFT_918694 [Melampsora americana]|nr:hypothetical protein DFH28DRAFT_918694 [Melampsora americana]
MEGYFCVHTDCGAAFFKKSDLDEHRRVFHQDKVTLTIQEEKVQVHRDGEKGFGCPLGSCVYSTGNPRYLTDHVKKCTGIGPVPVKLPTDLSKVGVVVPCGEDIEVNDILSKYNLAWNKKCKILVCVPCHVGIHISEVWGHFRRAHPPCNFSKSDVAVDLCDYADMIEGSVYPPGYVPGTPCEPVQGLMSYDGYTCKLCNLTWPCKGTLDNHFRISHAAGV